MDFPPNSNSGILHSTSRTSRPRLGIPIDPNVGQHPNSYLIPSKPRRTREYSIVDFYDPEIMACDNRGRVLEDIMDWSDTRLEESHNYIQVLFPLPEPSPFNDGASIIDQETVEAFHDRIELQLALTVPFNRMMAFYGLPITPIDEMPSELRTPQNFPAAGRQTWVRRFDHNHLRLTRIIRCCRVLGLTDEAARLWEALQDVQRLHGRISANSMMYWRRAATRPLHIRPDQDEEENITGMDFLQAFGADDTESDSAKDRVKKFRRKIAKARKAARKDRKTREKKAGARSNQAAVDEKEFSNEKDTSFKETS